MRINVVYSTQHWIFPIITIGVLVILGVLLIALEGRARIKAGKGFFAKPGRFFEENYDKVKFWGCLVLMFVYFFFLDKIGFTVWSIICLFLFNTLFANKEQMKNPKYHITSAIISVVACVVISLVFGTLFTITLPSGICTIEIPSLGFILY
ncbi:tripartite tricarboxylate transporter TctB family protein [Intestinimonas massiliensis (ex Afouda et al. 2020)]|uniref:tripartite tricarboxylate transporter TctB family protein n=1 Tax=Intestinimonas massiliensis (ex Afouda et al. 2020) TaxID=1673721 RepID=UPI00103064B4|nr:tripartite tricarboxylate transporter TctB family protein [Intestinimonas massiliensis (ex Afouda et al. 2020)]